MFAKILSFLTTFAPFVEPILLDIESSDVQPELKKLIGTLPDGGLKNLLNGIDQAFDAFVQSEIKTL